MRLVQVVLFHLFLEFLETGNIVGPEREFGFALGGPRVGLTLPLRGLVYFHGLLIPKKTLDLALLLFLGFVVLLQGLEVG